MLNLVVTLLIIALIAGLLGFGGIAGAAVGIAKIVFVVALEYLQTNGYLTEDDMSDELGHQLPNYEYPWLSRQEIVDAVEYFYGRYYFRLKVIYRIVRRAIFDSQERRRLYHEARDYLRLRARRKKFTGNVFEKTR